MNLAFSWSRDLIYLFRAFWDTERDFVEANNARNLRSWVESKKGAPCSASGGMSARDIITAESPGGNVLGIARLRQYLGLRVPENDASASKNPPDGQPEVLLIGHDMQGDLENLKKTEIDIGNFFHCLGCVDTHVIAKDMTDGMPKSLSALVEQYALAPCHWSKPKRKKKKRVFDGAHNAGNDAIATLKVAIAQALDKSIMGHGDKFSDDETDWCAKIPEGIRSGMILLAYDSENATNPNYKPSATYRVTEHGFAWLRLSDIANIAPGPNGVHWHPHIRAAHWINWDFRTYENSDYLVGNRDGFWPQYGESSFFKMKDGAAPFENFLTELASSMPFRDDPEATTQTGSKGTSDAAEDVALAAGAANAP